MKMKRFTVRRSKWARGGLNGPASLLNSQGSMCCLGFASCQIGRKTHETLLNTHMPSDVFCRTSFLTKTNPDSEVDNNELAIQAAMINDDKKLSEKQREQQLTTLFRKHKIIIKFVD